jgi:hypothetical protein
MTLAPEFRVTVATFAKVNQILLDNVIVFDVVSTLTISACIFGPFVGVIVILELLVKI